MKVTISKKEVLKTKTGVVWYKVHFEGKGGYYMVTPWQYSKVKLNNIFKEVAKSKVGESYEIKWREENFNGRSVSMLTTFETPEVVVQPPEPQYNTSVTPTPWEESEMTEDEWADCPF